MMPRMTALVLLAFAVLVSCRTAPPAAVEADPEEPVVVDAPPADPVPDPEPVLEEPEPVVEPPEPVEDPTAPIAVTEDLYNAAFAEVEAVINQLNEIIRRGDFERWKTFLTDRYIDYYSNDAVLAEISRQPFLVQNNIRLDSLRDYFEDVVGPSRAGARLDSLIFYTDTLVEAATVFRGQSVILYLLRKIDGVWTIDTFEVQPSDAAGE